MNRDISAFVKSCAYCRLSNTTSHEAQSILQAVKTQVPSDVLFLGEWSPGDFPEKWGALKVLTCLKGMSSFAKAVFLEKANSTTISLAVFTSFFIPKGLPKLVVFDAGNEFTGAMTKMCTNLGIIFHTVAKENHKAILNEHFHRYLNKVKKIHQADCKSLDQWIMGVFFALYGWNASPVDGTNVTRSLAAKGRGFHFPINVVEPPPPKVLKEQIQPNGC
jgi:hypothetical protein